MKKKKTKETSKSKKGRVLRVPGGKSQPVTIASQDQALATALVERLASRIALAVDNARLYESLERAVRALHRPDVRVRLALRHLVRLVERPDRDFRRDFLELIRIAQEQIRPVGPLEHREHVEQLLELLVVIERDAFARRHQRHAAVDRAGVDELKPEPPGEDQPDARVRPGSKSVFGRLRAKRHERASLRGRG